MIRKTPYTGGIIPIKDKALEKYADSKIRKKTIDEMKPLLENSTELEIYEKQLKEIDCKLGYLLCKISETSKQVNKLLKDRSEAMFMVDLSKRVKIEKDWVAKVEEIRYGIRPEYDEFKASMLNDDMIIGYLSNKLDCFTVATIKNIIERKGKN